VVPAAPVMNGQECGRRIPPLLFPFSFSLAPGRASYTHHNAYHPLVSHCSPSCVFLLFSLLFHRHRKIENVMLDSTGRLRLIDLGLCVVLGRSKAAIDAASSMGSVVKAGGKSAAGVGAGGGRGEGRGGGRGGEGDAATAGAPTGGGAAAEKSPARISMGSFVPSRTSEVAPIAAPAPAAPKPSLPQTPQQMASDKSGLTKGGERMDAVRRVLQQEGKACVE